MANEEQLAILRQGIEVWNKWRTATNDVKIDFTATSLCGADLSEFDLSEADFSETNLEGANLSGANLVSVNFRRTDLSGANLNEADLVNADFSDANLSGADLDKTDLFGANLSATNLSVANLYEAHLREANLSKANLTGAHFNQADLTSAILNQADLRQANLNRAHLGGANLSGANLSGANLTEAELTWANLCRANFHGAILSEANLGMTKCSKAIFIEADLSGANLSGANLSGANLSAANLSAATLVKTDLAGAKLSHCNIFGISAWKLKLDKNTRQADLVISDYEEPVITVDDLEIAQFVYLLLNNSKLREVIDTVGKKVVLILGRFIEQRKMVLDAIKQELRQRGYIPILFDFEKPATRNLTETIRILAGLSRFVIIDLSDPNSSPHEAVSVGEILQSVPLVPVFCPTKEHPKPYPMFEDRFQHAKHVLPIYWYQTKDELIASLAEKVIQPAEDKVKEVRPSPLS